MRMKNGVKAVYMLFFTPRLKVAGQFPEERPESNSEFVCGEETIALKGSGSELLTHDSRLTTHASRLTTHASRLTLPAPYHSPPNLFLLCDVFLRRDVS